MNVSSFFQGSALKFSLAGEGVTFDPATGELGLSSEALRAGFTVIVTAQPASGGEVQSFKLTVAAEPEAFAPVLLTPPVLTGSGQIGMALEVVPGTWSGQPAPAIALQWLRGGAEIEGETGAAYVPQAADDGQEITCRVTATNAAGALSAEPGSVRVTQAAPVVVGILADVTVEKGADPATVAAATAFAGEGLSFSVIGGGAAIDPATGLLTLPTDVVRDSETVTVIATNSGGSTEASFLLTVVVIVQLVPPAVITAPALHGTATIGSALTVETGLWSGLPLPLLAVQWLRDDAEIEGATAATYVPVPADDRCALSCRVIAANKAGSVAIETVALTATYAPPTRVGDLLDEVIDQAPGTATIQTAPVFAGENLSFSVTGAGAGIDPATGVLTFSTETALSAEVTVTATNSGGSVEVSFFLTIEAYGPIAPSYITPDLIEFKGIPAADGGVIYSSAFGADIQRARTVLKAGITIPKTHELLLIRSLTENPSLGFAVNIHTLPGLESYDGLADAIWDSSNGAKDGVTQYLHLYWRELASGTVTEALEVPAKFDSLVARQNTNPAFPTANQTLSAATQNALTAALDSRISAGSSDTWIIDLPNGNYGNLNLNGRQMPGKTILRSQNLALGAKFSGLEMSGCRNIHFQLVDVDRTIGGASNYGVRMSPANDCGISYSRIYVGGITPAAQNGWVQNVNYGIEINNVGEDRSNRVLVHMNLISGPCSKQIYVNGAFDTEISDNIGENAGGDFIHHGWGSRVKYHRNWDARRYYPVWTASGGWDHNDFIQLNSRIMEGIELIGNVQMVGSGGGVPSSIGLPRQSIFSGASKGSGWIIRDNISCSNSYHGVTTGSEFTNMTVKNNTVLRCIDSPGDQHTTQFSLMGVVDIGFNVQCGFAGNTSMGPNGLNIPMTNSDHTASRTYYTNPVMAASFYDLRPVEGKITHWNYSAGTPIGAHKRFKDVIIGGVYPKIGPAATAWKTWYDPKNQIGS